ncbi:hypothetical protein X797_012420 [Metarhizium robertsii]|uniref:Uncharacterized protein n=1 Tax=Metarhizium robertsii TaxID=568076 RepID=A0A014MTQ1_9HYPO|nr:hypothetical protein X797_012420 [Metarhizium robertsii]
MLLPPIVVIAATASAAVAGIPVGEAVAGKRQAPTCFWSGTAPFCAGACSDPASKVVSEIRWYYSITERILMCKLCTVWCINLQLHNLTHGQPQNVPQLDDGYPKEISTSSRTTPLDDNASQVYSSRASR